LSGITLAGAEAIAVRHGCDGFVVMNLPDPHQLLARPALVDRRGRLPAQHARARQDDHERRSRNRLG